MTDEADLSEMVTTSASAASDPAGEHVHSCIIQPVVTPDHSLTETQLLSIQMLRTNTLWKTQPASPSIAPERQYDKCFFFLHKMCFKIEI